MGFRTRIYETVKMGKGKRIVTSGKMSDWFAYGIVKFIFKAMFFLCFFWIIIPIKLLKKKK